MLAELGFGILILTFLTAVYGVAAALYACFTPQDSKFAAGSLESARLAMLLACPLTCLSVLCLLILLATCDFSVQYVYSVVNTSMPLYLRLTALWGGQAGSLLFWSWCMAACASFTAWRPFSEQRRHLAWVIVVCLGTLAIFLALTLFVEPPFLRFWQMMGMEVLSVFPPAGGSLIIPTEGYGLNPLLRHPGMILHPPALYLGFVSFVIPFACAVAALATGTNDDHWMRLTHRWPLAAWLFLSLGLLLGARWAYDVLGWGGYWNWDPVETSAFMPWLTCTAYLHSAIIQERRALFRRWNLLLVILTYCLVIFGTFLTRSGVFSSVHAFTETALGPLFFIFIALTFAASLGLLLYRWNDLGSRGEVKSLLSREVLFLFNNLLFFGVLLVCFWGVIFPLISELFTGQQVTVGPPYYERAAGPLLGAIVVMMGVAPLSAWGRSTWRTLGRAAWPPLVLSLVVLPLAWWFDVRRALPLLGLWMAALSALLTVCEYGRSVLMRHRNTGESLPLAFWKLAGKNRRRYGGYIIHLGVALMALGMVGIEMLQSETQATIIKGESIHLSGYALTFDDLQMYDSGDGRLIAEASLHVARAGKLLGNLNPRLDYYYDAGQTMTIPGLRSTLAGDLYVILANWAGESQQVTDEAITFKVYHNPLVNWLWIGSAVLVLGTLVAAWPGRSS